MQNTKKYSLSKEVQWKNVLKIIRHSIFVDTFNANEYIDLYNRDVEHDFPEELERHLTFAMNYAKEVDTGIKTLNQVRAFLKYPQKIYDDKYTLRVLSFYNEHINEYKN